MNSVRMQSVHPAFETVKIDALPGRRAYKYADVREALLALPAGEAIRIDPARYPRLILTESGHPVAVEAALCGRRTLGAPIRQRTRDGALYIWLDRAAATTGGAA